MWLMMFDQLSSWSISLQQHALYFQRSAVHTQRWSISADRQVQSQSWDRFCTQDMRVSIQADGEKSAASRSQPSNLEHTGSSLRKSTSYLSQVTTLAAGTDDESISVGSSTDQSSAESDDGEPAFEEDELELISIWTWQTIGLPVSGFLLAFLNAIASGVVYGFFPGVHGIGFIRHGVGCRHS